MLHQPFYLEADDDGGMRQAKPLALVGEVVVRGPLRDRPVNQQAERERFGYAALVDIQKSAFGSLEYDFTDRLTGTVELRYTKESQDLDNVFDNYFGGRGRFGASSSFTVSDFSDPSRTTMTVAFDPGAESATRLRSVLKS